MTIQKHFPSLPILLIETENFKVKLYSLWICFWKRQEILQDHTQIYAPKLFILLLFYNCIISVSHPYKFYVFVFYFFVYMSASMVLHNIWLQVLQMLTPPLVPQNLAPRDFVSCLEHSKSSISPASHYTLKVHVT
jgi:hypothetical protein